jgi:four helix bundle protein
MATFTRFEDIEGWKKARQLTREVYRLSNGGAMSRDFGLRDQMRRASVSVMANIAEGFGRGGNKEFISFLSIARGSCAEVKSHAFVALDAGLLNEADARQIQDLASESEALVSGLIKYLAASDARGRKFASANREP